MCFTSCDGSHHSCALHILAQSSSRVLDIVTRIVVVRVSYMPHHMKPYQQTQLERLEAEEAAEAEQEDFAGNRVTKDLGPMFLRSYILKVFCASGSMG